VALALRRRLKSLRARLVGAFLIVAVVPILAVSLALTRSVARSYEEASERRLALAVDAVRLRLAELRKLAEARVATIALRDLPAARVEDDATLTSPAVLQHDLPVLEIVAASGETISSLHWPAGLGLPDADVVFPGDGSLRLQRVGEGHGSRERLTVTASRAAVWRGANVVVRGGYFLDEDFLSSLRTPLGMTVGLRDGLRREWRTPSSSPLNAWSDPRLDASRGDVTLAGVRYRWAATRLQPGLWGVVALPATEISRVTGDLLRVAAVATGTAVLASVLAALWLSGWIATPIQRLARALPAVAEGSRSEPLPESGSAELAALAAAFNRMTGELHLSRERLLQAERVAAWREMARRLAHELKNPIFPIQVSIETLRRAVDRGAAGGRPLGGPGHEEFARLLRESCDTILDELRLLRGIVDEFSRFARLPQPTFRPTDLNEVVRQVLALHGPRAAGVSIEAELGEELPTILADRDLLALALGNFVANAFDAMPESGTLRVRSARAEGGALVEVADTGPGIAGEQRTRLFTPYSTTKRGGTGLGLSIAQSVVSDHGGRIEVRSAPGEGTAFTLLLPLQPPAAARSPREAHVSQAPSSRTEET
jgi:two-component system, NtrC family, nitrogen regulation sensor histidine kinase NtrY